MVKSHQPKIDDLGGLWIRGAAQIIDSVIMTFCGLFVGIAFGIANGIIGGDAIPSPVVIAASISMNIVYLTAFQSLFEGTLGKHLMGLRLVTTKYETPSITQGFLRYFSLLVGSLPFGLGYLSIGWNRRKQGWHDRAAKTLVVRKSFLDRVRGNDEAKSPPAHSPLKRAA